jgi:hypothetical protein
MVQSLVLPDYPVVLDWLPVCCMEPSDCPGNAFSAPAAKSSCAATQPWNSGFDWNQKV